MELTTPRTDHRAPEEQTCPGCRSALHAEDIIWDCPVCKATHHTQCAQVRGKCAVTDCPGALPGEGPMPAARYRQQFVTTRRDDTIITRLRTPEAVWAGFAAKSLAGVFIFGHALWRFATLAGPENLKMIGDGSVVPLFLGVAIALSPLREILRIRDAGYEKRRAHLSYLVVLTTVTVTLLGLCISACFNEDSFRTLAWTAFLAVLLDLIWPR